MRPPTAPPPQPARTPTSARCSRTAFARSPERCATRSTSTAHRTAAAEVVTRRAERLGARPTRLRRGAGGLARHRSPGESVGLARAEPRGHGLDAPPGGRGRPRHRRRRRDESRQPHSPRATRRRLARRRSLRGRRIHRARAARQACGPRACCTGSRATTFPPGAPKLASVTAQTQQTQERARQLSHYTSFIDAARPAYAGDRRLVDSRFDWAHAFHELGRVLPARAPRSPRSDGNVGDRRDRRRHPASAPAPARARAPAARRRRSPRRRRQAACRRSRSPAARRARPRSPRCSTACA